MDEVPHSYMELDAPTRRLSFPGFVDTLKQWRKEGRIAEAAEWAARAVSIDLDYSSLQRLGTLLKQAPLQGTDPLRLAILGGGTTTQLASVIEAFLRHAGIPTRIWEGEYGLFRQSILLPDADLDAFRPQVLFLAVDSRDFGPSPALSLSLADASKAAETALEEWQHLWRTAHARWSCQVIQNLPDIAPWGPLGHFGSRHPAGREFWLTRLTLLMAEQAPNYVALHNLHTLALETGAEAWFDPRFYHEAKMPCGPECLVPYGHSVASLVAALKGKSRKVLVLDLDNTLWGGVVGDDGVGGIRVGQGSAEGEAFLAFQSYCKALRQRGILLAVCSKNDIQNAREPFERLHEMPLKLDDFAAFIANWDNKADNLRTMAARLNLGLDAFVFVDDNPAERALVRRFAPDVAVPDLPDDPAGYIRAVARHRCFELVSLTDEDLRRSDFYSLDQKRRQLEASHADLDSFLASLEMEARVEPIHDLNIERSTQLINKSNQFNLTTRRYTLAEIRSLCEDAGWFTLTIGLKDRLGDHGLISVILARREVSDLTVDTWVMSCRVLQRGVEAFAMNSLVELARQHACERIRGTYIPTKKNEMVRDHFAKLGFDKGREEIDGTTQWERRIGPDWTPFAVPIEKRGPGQS